MTQERSNGADRLPAENTGFPQESLDWRLLEERLLKLVRRELGDGLRRRLESMDVVQDVMQELVRERQELGADKVRNFQAWLGRVVHNRIRNLAEFHTARCRDVSREASASGCDDVHGSDVPRPDVQAQAAEDYQRLLLAMTGLSEAERLVIVLRTFEDLSWDQIAIETGKATPDAARMAFSRAMVQLTGCFDRQHGAP